MTTKHKTIPDAPASTPAPASTASPPKASAAATNTPLVTATTAGNNRGTKVDLQATYQSVIAGLFEYYLPTDTFQMAQGTLTRDQIITQFQSFVTACQSTKTANQAWRAAIQSERTLQVTMRDLRKGVRGIVQARFGAAGAQNLQFGFTLVKPRKASTETKAIAVEKGKATRKERNTLGSVQKKKIKGNVNVQIVVTPGPGSEDASTASTIGTTPGSMQSAGQAVAQSNASPNGAGATPTITATPAGTPSAGTPSATGH